MALIKKSNDLIQAKYNLSKNEQKLILYLVSKINRPDKEFQTYTFQFIELVEVIGLSKTLVYEEMNDLAQNLLKKPICFEINHGVKEYANWVSYFKIDSIQKQVSIRFDPLLKPYLLQLNKYFTAYKLQYVQDFSCKYSFRLYEFCKQYQNTDSKQRTLSLIEFKALLEISDKYSRLPDLKKDVISRAIKDINSFSDIAVKVRYKKTSRRITHLVFDIKDKLKHCHTELQEQQGHNATVQQAKKQQERDKQAKVAELKKKLWQTMTTEEKKAYHQVESIGFVRFMGEN